MSDQVVKRNCIDLCRSRFTQEVFGIFPEAESHSELRPHRANGSLLMKPVVENLALDEMLALAAYSASLPLEEASKKK
jgi:hypothetical protein